MADDPVLGPNGWPTYPVEDGKLVFPQGTPADERIRASRAQFPAGRDKK